MAPEHAKHPEKPIHRNHDPSVKATENGADGQVHGVPEEAGRHEPKGSPTSDRHHTEVDPTLQQEKSPDRPSRG